jgi:hypothetical protein
MVEKISNENELKLLSVYMHASRERERERDRERQRGRELPACLGRALQLSWPCFWMKVMSLKSSDGLQGPLFTWLLSQHGALPFPMNDLSTTRSLLFNSTASTFSIYTKERWGPGGAFQLIGHTGHAMEWEPWCRNK